MKGHINDLDVAASASQPAVSDGGSLYEMEFARFLGSDVHALTFWKGRVALFAILKALGIGLGDEAILPGFTCVVVPNAIRFVGAKPVYVDILPNDYNLDPSKVIAAITKKTKALLVQHTFGIAANLNEFLNIAAEHDLFVVSDCAHALGTTLSGKDVGLYGDAAFFSSQWSKPYTTGLGGMAVTQNPELAQELRCIQTEFVQPPPVSRFRLFAQYQAYQSFFSPRLYWWAQGLLRGLGRVGLFVGSSSDAELTGQKPDDHHWRMARYQQRAGLQQLYKLRSNIERRRALAALYDEGLTQGGWPTAQRSDGSVLLRYPVKVGNKDELLQKARRERVELGSWFESPLHPVPLSVHQVFGYSPGECPNAEAVVGQVVNLPMHSRVTTTEAHRILRFFLSSTEPSAHD